MTERRLPAGSRRGSGGEVSRGLPPANLRVFLWRVMAMATVSAFLRLEPAGSRRSNCIVPAKTDALPGGLTPWLKIAETDSWVCLSSVFHL